MSGSLHERVIGLNLTFYFSKPFIKLVLLRSFLPGTFA